VPVVGSRAQVPSAMVLLAGRTRPLRAGTDMQP
jgi:hypothetical protein